MRPVGPPTLKGAAPAYQFGSLLNLSCSSKPGHPPSTLTWSINRRKVKAANFRNIQMPDGLTVSTSVLVLQLSSPKMPSEIQVKCSANIGQLYSQQTVARIHLVKPDQPRMGEPLLSNTAGERVSLLAIFSILTCCVNDT